MSADTTPGLEAERTAFEAWALHEGWTPTKLMRGMSATYAWAALNDAWEVWQAARRAPAAAPQGPTDAELIAFQEEEQYGLYCDPDDFVDIARAVLARWGAPAASGEPVARKPLTDAEINSIHNELCSTTGANYRSVARAIEAAHGIKP